MKSDLMNNRYNNPIESLIQSLSKLPGLGQRSARRVALHLLSDKDGALKTLTHTLDDAAQNVQVCGTCYNLDTANPCNVCTGAKRDRNQICVVGHVSDVWAIERTGSYKGLYHVLGGVLSAIDGIGPDQLSINALIQRIDTEKPREVILALSATINGQSTGHYINDLIRDPDIAITRLAHGVPVGGELDYLDDGTIMTALKARREG